MQSRAVDYSAGAIIGYNRGPGFSVNGVLDNFAKGFPFKIRFGVGYNIVNDPGSPTAARKIFINNATNGRPEEKGWEWEFRSDFLYRVKWLRLNDAYLYGGPRYVLFTANFNFVDGNENFDVHSGHWGWGAGLMTFFRMSNNLKLVADTGLDYFFPAKLTGHDTTYDPDGEDINPREDYTYDDADEALNQPKLGMHLMLGIIYSF